MQSQMEIFLSNKVCSSHQLKCKGIKMTSTQNLQQKLCCSKCVQEIQKVNNNQIVINFQEVESIITYLKNTQLPKKELVTESYNLCQELNLKLEQQLMKYNSLFKNEQLMKFIKNVDIQKPNLNEQDINLILEINLHQQQLILIKQNLQQTIKQLEMFNSNILNISQSVDSYYIQRLKSSSNLSDILQTPFQQYIQKQKCIYHQEQCSFIKRQQNTELKNNFRCEQCKKSDYISIKEIEKQLSNYQDIKGKYLDQKNNKYSQDLQNIDLINEFQEALNQIKNIQIIQIGIIDSFNIDFLNDFSDQSIIKAIEICLNKNEEQFKKSLIEDYQRYLNQSQINYQKEFSNNLENVQQLYDKLRQQFIKIQSNNSQNIFNNSDKVIQQSLITQKPIIREVIQKEDNKNVAVSYNQINNIELFDCYSMNLNFQNNLLACGGKKKIKIYQFEEQNLKPLVELDAHEQTILFIQFSQTTNNFISCSKDKIAKVWETNDNINWNCKFRLSGHNGWINNALFNERKKEIITSSCDKSIIVWRKQDQEWKNFQQLQDHQEPVWQLTYNQYSTCLQFISFGVSKFILWNKSYATGQYALKHQMNNLQTGINIQFINQQIIATQEGNKITLYKISDNEKDSIIQLKNIQFTYQQYQDILIFPLLYNSNNNLIFAKFSNQIFIIKLNEMDYEMKIQQELLFKDDSIIGSLTSDGKFLIVHNKETIIYKLQDNNIQQ